MREVITKTVMSLNESNVSSDASSGKEYDEDKTKLLYCTVKEVSIGSGN